MGSLLAGTVLLGGILIGGCFDGPGQATVGRRPPSTFVVRTPVTAPATPGWAVDRPGWAEDGLTPLAVEGTFLEPDGRMRVDCDSHEVLCDDEEA